MGGATTAIGLLPGVRHDRRRGSDPAGADAAPPGIRDGWRVRRRGDLRRRERPGRRAWLLHQLSSRSTATLGLLISMATILGVQHSLSHRRVRALGLAPPLHLLALPACDRRLGAANLVESPLWERMQLREATLAANRSSTRRGAGRSWSLALFGATAGQGVIWYTAQFFSPQFMTKSLGLPRQTADAASCDRLALRDAVLHRVRRALRSDRSEAADGDREPARGDQLLPHLPSDADGLQPLQRGADDRAGVRPGAPGDR